MGLIADCSEDCSGDNLCYKTNIGLDSLDIVHNQISQILYPKPNTSKKTLKSLKKFSNTKLFYIVNGKTNNKTCVCEIFPQTNSKSTHMIIFAHGNGCDVYTFYDYLKWLANNLGVIVVCWDYPQYGLSTGNLDEFGCYDSMDDVVSHYIKFTQKILLCGQSLGTGVVVDYISKNSWTNPVILISPYKSIPKVITQINLLENLICKNKFSTYKKINKTNCPIKIFHGKLDNLIDISHSVELFNMIPNKTLKPTFIPNTTHNDILEKIDLNEFIGLIQMI